MKIALIDADVNAFQAAVVNEKSICWGDPEDETALWTLHAHEEEVIQTFRASINAIQEAVGADKVILAFSDKANWRKDVLPTYKANRAGSRQPMLRGFITQWAKENYETFTRPTLEGDDVLGILATRKNPDGDEYVICTIDKDMKTIPGTHYNFGRKEHFMVTEAEADRWHLYQTLVGDATDNYPGCPGIGPVAAERILNKDPSWAAVVAAFDKAGLGEEEALVQARVARICRASDYDFKTKQVKLWNPNSK